MVSWLTLARLWIDILSMRLFVVILGRDGELLDSHLFFYARYLALADYYFEKGQITTAARFEARAEVHFQAAPDDDGPREAAMAMPVPRPWLFTNAVAGAPARTSRANRSSRLETSLVR